MSALAGYNAEATLIPHVPARISATYGGGVPAGIVGSKNRAAAAPGNKVTIPAAVVAPAAAAPGNKVTIPAAPAVSNQASSPAAAAEATGSKDIYLGDVLFAKMANPANKSYSAILSDAGSKKLADLLHLDELELPEDKKIRILQEMYESECLKDASLGASGKCENIRDVLLLLSTVLVKIMAEASTQPTVTAGVIPGGPAGGPAEPKKDIIRIQIDIPISKFGNLSGKPTSV